MRQRASDRLKRDAETKWEKRRRHALLRREERRNQAGKPITETRCFESRCHPGMRLFYSRRFWDRPRTTLEQKHLNKKLAKKAKKDAAKRRLEKYKKRVEAQKPTPAAA